VYLRPAFGSNVAIRGTLAVAPHGHAASSTGISVAVPSSHVALLDPVLGKHDQGAAHGLGRHGLGPIRFGTARDWQRAEVGLAAGQALAVGMAALRVQGSSNGCWRPTRLLLGHKHWWCASNLHVFHLRRTARIHGIALCPGIGAHMLCTLYDPILRFTACTAHLQPPKQRNSNAPQPPANGRTSL